MWWQKTAREPVADQPARSALALALEARMMFDGAVAATTVDAADATKPTDAPGAQGSQTDTAQHDSAPDSLAATPAGTADNRQEVVFVNSNVENYQQLVSGLKPGTQVVVLDANKDGLQQMADYLDGRSGVDAIHVLSHGRVGQVQLGNEWLDSTNLAGRSELLNAIGQSMAADGDILLYGCQVGAAGEGYALIEGLAQATGADVAASNDLTGAASMGGDWVLEVNHGEIQSRVIDSVASYSGLLVAADENYDDDPGQTFSTSVFTLDGVRYTITGTGGPNYSTQVSNDASFSPLGNNGSDYYLLLDSGGIFGVSSIKVEMIDGSAFRLAGLSIDALADSNVSITPEGGSAISYVSNGAYVTLENISFLANTQFQNITSFTISGQNLLLNLDDLNFEAAVPPTVAPSLSATATDPAFTENGSAVDLFNAVTAATNDAGQTFSGMTLTVTNVSDGATEFLNIGGIDISLAHGTSGSLGGLGNYNVALVGGTATITLSGLTRDNTQMAQLIDAMSYRNTSDNPGSASRVVSITSIVDNGASNNSTNPGVSSSVTVTAVNDMPTLSPTNASTGYTENGAGAALIPTLSIGDPDSPNFQGATVTIADFRAGDVLSVGSNPGAFTVNFDSGTGVLTLSGGGSMADLQTALRSVTYSSTSDDPTFGGTDGTRQINFSVTDGSGASSGAATAQVAVTAVNDAPTLSAGPYTWAATNEDVTSTAVTVSSLLSSLSASDPDSASVGIAITASGGNGTWQYSTDGSTWFDVGVVSGNAALLLSASSQLRFVPDGQNGGASTLGFRAWDRSSGSATVGGTRATADTSSNGGSTAFSSTVAQASLSVSSVNDAPLLTPVAPTLTGLTDSEVNNPGQSVSSFAGGNISDVDSGALQGIAITGLDAGNGTWQYSVDGGGTWLDVGSVSNGSALLLRGNDRVRLVPDGIHGTSATLTYRAWDQSGATSGQQGTKVDASASGGSAPFSTATDTASITVTAVNDAPLVTSSGGSAAFVEGDNVASTPVVIDGGITVSDNDSPLLYGATVRITGNFMSGQDVLGFTSNPATQGDITGSYDASTGTLTLTSASGASAAQWQAALRSVTYSNSSENPVTANRTISFIVNDGVADSATANRTVTVTRTNDAPIASMPSGITVVEDVSSAITGISFSDADAGAGNVTVTLSVPSGMLSAVSGGGVTIGGTASVLTLAGSISDINAFIASGNVSYLTALDSTASVTLTASISDNGLSGGAPKSDSETVQLTVTAVNDAPAINAPASINVTEDVPQALTGISFSDVDAGSGIVNVLFSVAPGSGTLTASSAAGVTVLGSGSGTLSLAGTLADINAFIVGGAVSFTTASNATSNVVLSLGIDDGGNTGAGGNQSDSTTVTLAVTAVNDAPVNTVPGSQSVLQDGNLIFNAGNGNAVSIADVDVGGGTVRVSLTASNGLITLGSTMGLVFSVGSGTGDGTMTFDGSIIDINNALAGLTFSPTSGYSGPASLQITTNDLGLSGMGGNQTDTDTIAINVALPNPSVVSVDTSSPDSVYKVGDTVLVTVTFDQAVSVSGGTPTLLLETGLIDRTAVYQSGSGTTTLTFAYVVQAGDQSADLNYSSIGALQLNGSSITSVSLGNPAFTSLPDPADVQSLGGNADLVIDGVAPTVTSVSVPANGTYTAGQNLDFTVNLSEAVTVDTSSGTPRLAITLDGGGTVFANYLSGSGTTALVFRLTVASGQFDANGISVGSSLQANGGTLRDAAGNDINASLNSVGSTAGVRVDAVAPVVGSVSVPVGASYNAGDTLTFVVNASEAVVVSGTPRLALDIGGSTVFADYVSGSGTSALVFQYSIQPGDNDADGIAVGGLSANGGTLRDAAGNDMNLTLNGIGSTSGVMVDTVAPTPSGIVSVDPSPTNAGSVRYTVTFSEDVSGVDLSDFTLVSTGSAAGSLSGLVQVDGHTYQLTVSGLSGTGTLGLNLNGAGTGILDAAGNALSGGLGGAVYSIDRDVPTVTSVGVPANGTYTAGQNLDFTVNLNEAVTVDTSGGTPRIAITLDGGNTVFANYLSGSGTTALVFRLTVASGQLDANGISVGSSIQANGGTLRDAVGNDANTSLNSVGSTADVRVDAVAPVVGSVSVPVGASYNAGDTLTFVVNASEAVVVSGTPRLALDIGGSTVFADYVSGSGTSALVFQYSIQPGDNDADGIAVGGLSANGGTLRDAAGNDMNLTLNGIGNTSGVMVDTVAPTPSGIVSVDPSPTNAGSVRYTVTFSEDVSGVDLSDFSLVSTGSAAGSLSGLVQVDGHTYQLTVSGLSGTGTLGLNLNGAGTGIVDLAGNTITGGLSGAVYSIDRDVPIVTSVSVPPPGLHVAGDTLVFEVDVSEAVFVSGTPHLTIDMGGRTVLADYVSGSGGTRLVFHYTVQQGDNDSDGIRVVGLSENGGSLRDATGNALRPGLSGVGDSRGVLVDTRAPTATGVVRLDPSPTSASSVNFLVTFDEDVSGVDASDFSLVTSHSASGRLVSVTQIDARSYRITVDDVSGQGSLGLAVNGGAINDAAGNLLSQTLSGDSYAIGSLSDGDPEFRITTPPVPPLPSVVPLQPVVPAVVAAPADSPLAPPSLFEPPSLGGLPSLGNVFSQHGAPSQSLIAQVFGDSGFGDGTGKGFLGFGGGDAGVFGSSTLSSLFDRDNFDESKPLNVFDRRSGGIEQGIRGVFGAPSLTQQLHGIRDAEQQPLRELAWALGQIAQDRDAS